MWNAIRIRSRSRGFPSSVRRGGLGEALKSKTGHSGSYGPAPDGRRRARFRRTIGDAPDGGLCWQRGESNPKCVRTPHLACRALADQRTTPPHLDQGVERRIPCIPLGY